MNFFRFILLLLASMAMLRGSHAETIGEITNPKRTNNSWVSDMASVLTARNEQRINNAINQLERTNGAEMAVVTIYRTDGSTPKQFATRLFNTWGIGKRERNNGILILLVMQEHRIEVETGTGLARILPDERVHNILSQHVIPHFKEDDYNSGVWAGVQALARALSRPPGRGSPPMTALPVQPPAPAATPNAGQEKLNTVPGETGSPLGKWLKLLIGSLFLPAGGWALYRSRMRYCPQCKQRMRRLTESEDDALLAYDQQFEEQLGSVDYHVWQCDSCRTVTAERAVKWMSGYSACPKCTHMTLASQTTILRYPTYTQTGESLVTHSCRFPGCGYSAQEHRLLPVETPPPPPQQQTTSSNSFFSSQSSTYRSPSSRSSSDSGDFGGGSSRGGGAGASW